MMRTRSRQRPAARSRFADTSQKPPSAASESVIRRIALTATRPARRRSRSASPTRKPNIARSALVLHAPAGLERERPPAQRRGDPRLVGREDHGRAARPDVPEHLEDLRGHRVVEAPGRSEEHTSELQSQSNLVCRLLLEKKK